MAKKQATARRKKRAAHVYRVRLSERTYAAADTLRRRYGQKTVAGFLAVMVEEMRRVELGGFVAFASLASLTRPQARNGRH